LTRRSASGYVDADSNEVRSLYQTLQILSVNLFERTPISQALQPPDMDPNQLILFDL